MIGDTIVIVGSERSTGRITEAFFDLSTDGGTTWQLQTHTPKSTFGTLTEPTAFSATDADHWRSAVEPALDDERAGTAWTTSRSSRDSRPSATCTRASDARRHRFRARRVADPDRTARRARSCRTRRCGETWATVALRRRRRTSPAGPSSTGRAGSSAARAHPLTPPPPGDPPGSSAPREPTPVPDPTVGRSGSIATYRVGDTSKGQFGQPLQVPRRVWRGPAIDGQCVGRRAAQQRDQRSGLIAATPAPRAGALDRRLARLRSVSAAAPSAQAAPATSRRTPARASAAWAASSSASARNAASALVSRPGAVDVDLGRKLGHVGEDGHAVVATSTKPPCTANPARPSSTSPAPANGQRAEERHVLSSNGCRHPRRAHDHHARTR